MADYAFIDFCRSCLEEFKAAEGVNVPELASFIEDPELQDKTFDEEDYGLAARALFRFIAGLDERDYADLASVVEDFPKLRALTGLRPDPADVSTLIGVCAGEGERSRDLFAGFACIFFNALLRQKRIQRSGHR